jgi:uncharacterized protein
MKHLFLALIAVYRAGISPLMAPHCRFHPTCSAYAQEALRVHGARRGLWLALRRIIRCHPFYKGPALDPVPAPGANPQSPGSPARPD